MQEEKRKKVFKIISWVAFGLAVLAIIIMCIVSAVYKKETSVIEDENQQIEDILKEEEQASLSLISLK